MGPLCLVLSEWPRIHELRGNSFQPAFAPEIKAGTITADAAALTEGALENHGVAHGTHGAMLVLKANLFDPFQYAGLLAAIVPHFGHESEPEIFPGVIESPLDLLPRFQAPEHPDHVLLVRRERKGPDSPSAQEIVPLSNQLWLNIQSHE